jgi:hypothetical protein
MAPYRIELDRRVLSEALWRSFPVPPIRERVPKQDRVIVRPAELVTVLAAVKVLEPSPELRVGLPQAPHE